MIRDPAARALLIRRVRFAAINLLALAFIGGLVIAPLVSEMAQQCENIADRADQLARLTAITANAAPLRNDAGKNDEIFLPGNEERLASADLQANLKAVAGSTGARFRGVRAVSPGRAVGARMVAVGLDLEGSPEALRDTFRIIEAGRPMLFVTSLVLRPAAGAADGILRAELTVQGAMRDSRSGTSTAGLLP